MAVKSMDIRDNFKEWCNKAVEGETIVVSGPKDENVVILSETEYNKMLKAKRNADYLIRLDQSYDQLKRGEVVVKSMEELEHMADE